MHRISLCTLDLATQPHITSRDRYAFVGIAINFHAHRRRDCHQCRFDMIMVDIDMTMHSDIGDAARSVEMVRGIRGPRKWKKQHGRAARAH